MDTLTPKMRSERMSLIHNKDTGPEIRVRHLLHALGYRYRLHSRSLPGHPDIVFTSRRKVIFVHGCFWHRHHGCPLTRWPKSRLDFWVPKLEGNRIRDQRNHELLKEHGWDSYVVWECETADLENLKRQLIQFLGSRL